MGIRIVLTTLGGGEAVDIVDDDDVECFCVSYAEFKAACCRDLGLVDPNVIKTYGFGSTEDTVDDMAIWQIDYTREAYEAIRSKLIGRSKAADVLAAASRRLA